MPPASDSTDPVLEPADREAAASPAREPDRGELVGR